MNHAHEARPLTDYPELMTVAETAEYLRIALSTCYLLVHNDSTEPASFPSTRIGGRIPVIRDRLPDFLASHPA